ncbi:hypothetical protein Tco_0790395 [Tanacetum coccineum]
MEECHKMLTDQVDGANPEGDQVRINVNRPLPLGGPLGHVTIQTQFLFNKDLEYLRYGSKGSCLALSIFKMKAANYPDFGLELLVPEQIDFEDLNLLLLQGHLDHLSGLDKRMISTVVKLWTRNLLIRQQVLININHPAPKKRKLVKETPDDPLPAKRLKAGLVGKRCKAKSPLRLIDEPSDEGVPGPARPVVLREPDSEKFQPLPEVQGKGKEKFSEEQAAHDLLTL